MHEEPSFGYLVPVLLYSKRMNKPVIIATSTIALQEQLWRDVHAVMPLLGLNRDVILAKGQTHYLCNKRADEYMCDPKADPPDAIKEGIKQGYEERKDFPEVLPQGVWDKVNVQRFSMKNCGSCEKKCKYYKVRAALKFTDGVVLCNQDFLTQHLMKLRRGQEGLINAAADLLVVDEYEIIGLNLKSQLNQGFRGLVLFLLTLKIADKAIHRRQYAQNRNLSAERGAASLCSASTRHTLPTYISFRRSTELSACVDLHRVPLRHSTHVPVARAA